MFVKIFDFILNNSIVLIILILVIAILLFFGAIEKKRRNCWLCLILSILSIIGSGMSIFVFKDLVVFGLNLRLLIVGLSFLTLLVNLGVYIYSNRLFYNRLQLVKASINISGHKILAYLNQRAKLLYFTDAFTAILNIEKNQTDVFEELISSIFVDSQDMNFRPFLHYLKTPEERDYRVVLNLYNGNSLKLDLMKRKVIQNGRLLGYVLLNQSTTAVQEASSLSFNHYHYLNFMDEAICYFDLKSRRYILTQEMVKLLGVQDAQISENSFKSAVVGEDLPILEKEKSLKTTKSCFIVCKLLKERFGLKKTIFIMMIKFMC